MPSVLLIEDDPIMGESICDRFMLEQIDHEWIQSGAAALSRMKQRKFDCLICDIRLPDISGEILYQRAQEQGFIDYPAIFITGYGTPAQADRLMSKGAVDYLTKPLEMEHLVSRIRFLTDGRGGPLTKANKPTLGISREIRRLEEMAVKLGNQWNSILISGESGAGKEELARVLHQSAVGELKPFITVNCGAIPENLIEAELFGYERGAFSGAVKAHRGYFEQSDGGTIFLDEIGEMPVAAQVRLLRVLQDRSFKRLGSEKVVKVDFKLITATHRDIREEVKSGRFREDLYYRINIIQLRVPPLRERTEDISWLAKLFLEQWNQTHPASPRMLSEQTLHFLCAQKWPGNVRELKHAVERACLLTAHPLLHPEDFDLASTVIEGIAGAQAPGASGIVSLAEYTREQERRYLIQVLDHYGGQMTQAAAALGISRKTLWDKAKKLGIRETAT